MPDPKVLVACPTWSGGAYALREWAEAVHAFTYPSYGTLMVDNSDLNLHYTHIIRAQDIDAIYQQRRFPYLWDTLELSWRIIVEHAHEEGYDYVLSLEHDLVAPPDTIEVLLAESRKDDPPAFVSHRYHPRGQETSDHWFDTLGCTLMPLKPLWERRNRVMSIYECEVFLSAEAEGYPRRRVKDLLDIKHLKDPEDKLISVFGGTPAPTAHYARSEELAKKQQEQLDELIKKKAGENPEEQPEIPMGEEATRERPIEALPVGSPADKEYAGRRKDEPHMGPNDHGDRTVLTNPQQALGLQRARWGAEEPVKTRKLALVLEDIHCASGEERRKLLETEALRLNLGCGFGQISGFIGVDMDEKVTPDILGPIDDLSAFESDSVDEIWASHVLEHLPMENKALEEWYRVLRPGGMLTVAVPDIMQTYYLYKHGSTWGDHNYPIDEQYIQAVAFGAYLLADNVPDLKWLDSPGQVHKQIFIGDMLLNRVLGAGYVEAHEVSQCFLRRSAMGETMVQGRKPYPNLRIEGE